MDADRFSRHLGYIDSVHGDHRGHQYLIREGEIGKKPEVL